MKDELKAFTPDQAGHIDKTPELKSNERTKRIAQQLNQAFKKLHQQHFGAVQAVQVAQSPELSATATELMKFEIEYKERLAKASGYVVVENLEPKFEALQEKLDNIDTKLTSVETKLDESDGKAAKRALWTGSLSGCIGAILFAIVSYLYITYVTTPTTTPTTTPNSSEQSNREIVMPYSDY